MMVKRQRWAAMLIALLFALGVCVPCMAADAGGDTPYMMNNDGRPMTSGAVLVRLRLELEREAGHGAYGTLLLDGAEVDAVQYVATGQRLKTWSKFDTLLRVREVVVLGDVTGTGCAGLDQLVRLARALSGADPLEGIWLAAGDLNGSGVIDLGDLVLAAGQYRVLRASEDVDLVPATLPFYVVSPENRMDMSVCYANGSEDIPFISEDDALDLMRLISDVREDREAVFIATEDGPVTTWTRENGSWVELNFLDSTVTFGNFNQFFQPTYCVTALDFVRGADYAAAEGVAYIERLDSSYERNGSPIFVDLVAYGIRLLYDDGTGYLPLQTFSDMFYCACGASLVSNGDMIAFPARGELGELRELYYEAESGERSEELCQFAYNELCLAMDMFYGLKEQHNIGDFDTLFRETGLKERLLSSDPVVADRALTDLLDGYLGDLHSQFIAPSFYAGEDADMSDCVISPSVEQLYDNYYEYNEARARAYPDGAPAYEEVGNTAYVTLDAFELPEMGTDYYAEPPGPDARDTLGIIMYAHSRIMREDSPVENVVLDLSCNTGGVADAAVFTIGWFLGGKAGGCINDTLTGMQAYTKYAVDVNADGVCDASDSVAGKNLYCLTSPLSLSCGNLVPSAFKASGKVTLIGRKSGGGACIVRPLTMADGTSFQISGPWRMSLLSNGSFYDVDKGIEPDHMIPRPERFYDREALTQHVNGLYR